MVGLEVGRFLQVGRVRGIDGVRVLSHPRSQGQHVFAVGVGPLAGRLADGGAVLRPGFVAYSHHEGQTLPEASRGVGRLRHCRRLCVGEGKALGAYGSGGELSDLRRADDPHVGAGFKRVHREGRLVEEPNRLHRAKRGDVHITVFEERSTYPAHTA